MKRKRFIKLLIGHGISRNDANWCAGFSAYDLTYEEIYDSISGRGLFGYK